MVLMGFLLVRNTQQIPTPASSILFQTKIDWLARMAKKPPSSTAGLLSIPVQKNLRRGSPSLLVRYSGQKPQPPQKPKPDNG
jgi:hypothetical protein